MNKLDTLNREILKLLIEHELLKPLIFKVLKKDLIKDVEIEKEVLIQIKTSIMEKEGLKNEEDFNSWLLKSNLDEDKFFSKIAKPMKMNKYALENFGHMTNARFIKRKSDLDTVTYSLIRVKDRFLAQELYLKILDDPSKFGELASKYSYGVEKNTQGIVGPNSLNQGHPVVQEKLKNSNIGEVNAPILIENVIWAIIRLESKEDSTLNEEMELILAKEILNESINDKADETIADLLKKNSLIEV